MEIVKDADYLEAAFQAKEYYDIGYKTARGWIRRTEKLLKTSSAKMLLKKLKKMDSAAWWENLKEEIISARS